MATDGHAGDSRPSVTAWHDSEGFSYPDDPACRKRQDSVVGTAGTVKSTSVTSGFESHVRLGVCVHPSVLLNVLRSFQPKMFRRACRQPYCRGKVVVFLGENTCPKSWPLQKRPGRGTTELIERTLSTSMRLPFRRRRLLGATSRGVRSKLVRLRFPTGCA